MVGRGWGRQKGNNPHYLRQTDQLRLDQQGGWEVVSEELDRKIDP